MTIADLGVTSDLRNWNTVLPQQKNSGLPTYAVSSYLKKNEKNEDEKIPYFLSANFFFIIHIKSKGNFFWKTY